MDGAAGRISLGMRRPSPLLLQTHGATLVCTQAAALASKAKGLCTALIQHTAATEVCSALKSKPIVPAVPTNVKRCFAAFKNEFQKTIAALKAHAKKIQAPCEDNTTSVTGWSYYYCLVYSEELFHALEARLPAGCY